MYENNKYKTGQIIPFGRYMQKHSSEYQVLEWMILDIRDDKALLLSKDGLITSGYCDFEYAQYNHRYLEWEYSRARAVLNGEFYYYAFSKEDKRIVREKKSEEWLTENLYKVIVDKVFLLTGEEVEKYLPKESERRAKPSERAKEKGALGEHMGFTAWWTMPKVEPVIGKLTSMAGVSYPRAVCCQFVTPDGNVNFHGRNIYHKDITLRPAVWIDLKEYAKVYEKKTTQEPRVSCLESSKDLEITRYYQHSGGGFFKVNQKNCSCYTLNQEEKKWIPDSSLLAEFAWGSFGATEIYRMDIAAIKEIKADPKEEKMVDITIGRSHDCDICLENPTVSKLHASLHYMGGKKGRWIVCDRNSRNGTFVNGERITKKELKKGDVIQIGVCQIVFKEYALEPGWLDIRCGDKKEMLVLPWKEILDQSLQKKKKSRYLGCFLGGAVGDALGYPVEFMSESRIFEKYGSAGIQMLDQAGRPAQISDDTQMHLFAANAVIYNEVNHEANSIKNILRAYQEWLGTQGDFCCLNSKEKPKMWIYEDERLHAIRAPGNTCLNAIRQTKGKTEIVYAENNSKGCGAVMRAAVFGLAYHYDAESSYGDDFKGVYTYAKYDAKLTHGHPMAVDASVALAFMIYEIVQRNPLRCQSLQEVIGLYGNSELNDLLRKAIKLALDMEVSDLAGIHALGEGWIAEEALAIALFCAVRYQDDFAKAIQVSVNHKGDSDSTGAICGYILGAWLGKEAVEQAFDLKNLELKDLIEEIAENLYLAVEKNVPAKGTDAYFDEKYRR